VLCKTIAITVLRFVKQLLLRAVITTLTGHIDYSFACCWSPDDRYLATGNQDKTTRIYDIRNMSETLHVLRANVGAIRSLHFSSDGRHLAVAGKNCTQVIYVASLLLISIISSEPLDFVHIYDATTYEQSQVIDFFGEIAGVCKCLFIERPECQCHTDSVRFGYNNLAFTPDDNSLFIANADDRVGYVSHILI
jgi:WD40 repeat protein